MAQGTILCSPLRIRTLARTRYVVRCRALLLCIYDLTISCDLKSQHHEPIDEDEVQNAHRKAYEQDSAEGMSASSMGSAAALQVRIPT
jgi:hypothetical protein